MSDRAADKGASGHTGQKSIGFGGTPTSIFAARKSQVSIHLPCLPLTRSPENAAKKAGGVFLNILLTNKFIPYIIASVTTWSPILHYASDRVVTSGEAICQQNCFLNWIETSK